MDEPIAESSPSFFSRIRSKLRRFTVLGLIAILCVVLVQNWTTLEFHLFMTTVQMPAAVMMLVFAGSGFLLGALWSWSKR